MTAELAQSPWWGDEQATQFEQQRPEAHDPQDPSLDELSQGVSAVGALMNWHSAVCIKYSPMHTRPAVITKAWTSTSGADVPPLPQWLERLDPTSWGPRQLVWRPALAPDPYLGAVVAVPLAMDGDVIGALVYFGPQLLEPDDAALGLLRAIAGALAPLTYRSRVQADVKVEKPPSKRPVSLIDVFSFTVRVSRDGDGTSCWEYFGPNSHAVFGEGIYPDQPLTDLLTRYVDPDDLAEMHRFTQAFNKGLQTESELRLVGSDGVTRWISVRIKPRWDDGTLFMDGVATDVSARRAIERSNEAVVTNHGHGQSLREHALKVREANDAVLQRLFAAGLRLQMLKSKLDDAEAHAVTAIVFQLDQATNDLREIVQGLHAVATDPAVL